MANRLLAINDLGKLVAMTSPLADELKYVVENGSEKQPEQFLGVSRETDS